MKRFFLIVVIALVSLQLGAQNNTADAEKAYESGEYNQAITLYTDILSSGKHSAELYYNLGNSYFKSDMLGLAILNYSRALRLDPSMEDARYNLDVASSRTIDKIEAVPEFFVITYLDGLRQTLGSNTWAVLSILFLVVALSGVVVWLTVSELIYRKIGFSVGVVALVFAVVAFWCSLVSYDQIESSRQAVIINTAAPVSSSPSAGSKDLFVLHEGTMVEVVERADNWCQIELANGEKGWVESHSLEII